VEYLDEGSSTVAKDALHNYKIDGENKIKVVSSISCALAPLTRISIPRRSRSRGRHDRRMAWFDQLSAGFGVLERVHFVYYSTTLFFS
jgi:hypothetical protein